MFMHLVFSLQADILQHRHDCNVVIFMQHKHGLGETITYYGTQGAGVAFIGNKADKKMSESGQMALRLFRKFMDGKIYSLKASF